MSDTTTREASDRDDIGIRLRQARESAGLSQGQAAKLLDLHRPTISEIEAGRRRVSIDELKRFALTYEVSFSWLAGEEPSSAGNARVQLVAREFAKLKKEDLERLVELFTILQHSGEGDQ